MGPEIRMRCNYRATREVGNGKVQTEFSFVPTDADGKIISTGIEGGSASMNVVGDAECTVLSMGDIVVFAAAPKAK